MNDISACCSEIICSSSCYVDVPYFGYTCSLYSCFFLTKFIDIETSVIDMSNDNQNGTTIMSYATLSVKMAAAAPAVNDRRGTSP